MKQITSLLVALCLILSLGTVAFAEGSFDGYDTVVSAYQQLEDSGWTELDEEIIGTSYFAALLEVGYSPDIDIQFEGYALNDLELVYVLYDINGDDTPELIIGANWSEFDLAFITGIYFSNNGDTLSAVQLNLEPYQSIEVLNNGTVGIKSGRMGFYAGYYIEFDEDGMAYVTGEWDGDQTLLDANDYSDMVVSLIWRPLSEFADNILEYEDVFSSWAQDEGEAAIAAGLVPDHLQWNYKGVVSRGDVALMFIQLIELCTGMDIDSFMAEQEVTINPDAFTDTDDASVLAANALGIINGIGNNQFHPDGTLTRAEIAAIINRTANVLGAQTEGYTHDFVDVDGHWVDSELGWPVHAKIINGIGNNKFAPDGKLTTQEAIVITYRGLMALEH